MGVNLNDVLSRLCRVSRQRDGSFMALCPAHDDHHPSLRVWKQDGRIRLKCFAGCDPREVWTALGFDPPARPPEGRTEPEAVYPYQNAEGRILATFVRYPGKKFLWKKPDGSLGVKGLQLPLYRLPEVLRAKKAEEPIYVVEGEKDVETLRALGLVATCSPNGAGKWREHHTEALVGAREVVILPDQDPPGETHAQAVARALFGKVGSLKVVNVPLGKDVSDWIGTLRREGKTEGEIRDVLLRLVGETEEWQREDGSSAVKPLGEALKESPEIEFLVEGLLARGQVSVLASQPGAGKTWLALDLALSATTGGPVWGRFSPTKKLRVLYILSDAGSPLLKSRLDLLGASVSPNLLYVNTLEEQANLDLSTLKGRSILEELVSGASPDLIILDSFSGLFTGDPDKAKDIGPIANFLRHLVIKTQCHVLVVHHFRKKASGLKTHIHDQDEIAGSGLLTRFVGLALGVFPSEEGGRRVVRPLKQWLAPIKPFEFEIAETETGGVELRYFHDVVEGDTKAETARLLILKWLGDGPLARQDILNRLNLRGISRATATRVLKTLHDEREIKREGKTREGVTYSLSNTTSVFEPNSTQTRSTGGFRLGSTLGSCESNSSPYEPNSSHDPNDESNHEPNVDQPPKRIYPLFGSNLHSIQESDPNSAHDPNSISDSNANTPDIPKPSESPEPDLPNPPPDVEIQLDELAALDRLAREAEEAEREGAISEEGKAKNVGWDSLPPWALPLDEEPEEEETKDVATWTL